MQRTCAIFSSVACLAVPMFSPCLINGTVIGKKKTGIGRKACFFILSTTFVRNISHSRVTERDIYKNVYWSPFKVLVILVKF